MIVLLVWFGESIEMCDRNAPRWKTERRKEKRERERETTSIRCRWCCGCGVDSIRFAFPAAWVPGLVPLAL